MGTGRNRWEQEWHTTRGTVRRDQEPMGRLVHTGQGARRARRGMEHSKVRVRKKERKRKKKKGKKSGLEKKS